MRRHPELVSGSMSAESSEKPERKTSTSEEKTKHLGADIQRRKDLLYLKDRMALYYRISVFLNSYVP